MLAADLQFSVLYFGFGFGTHICGPVVVVVAVVDDGWRTKIVRISTEDRMNNFDWIMSLNKHRN